jgi:hypothetical protein
MYLSSRAPNVGASISARGTSSLSCIRIACVGELHGASDSIGVSAQDKLLFSRCSIVTNVTAAGYILRPLLRIAPASACLLREPDRCPMRFVDTRVNLHCRLLPERILADCRNEIEALRNVA